MADSLLIARGLHFSYSKKPIIEDFDFSLSPGEIVSLLGPNGSGKSTLLRLLLGDLHGKGEIDWEARAIGQWPRRELARLIAYLPQNPVIDPTQTVTETLTLGRAPYWGAFGIETSTDADVINRVTERLQIDRDLLHRRMDQISGGQRQRIFIARCLVQQAKVLLLDEPTNNLDLKYQVQILGLLRELVKSERLAVFMSAHDLNLATEFSDRIVLLNEGKKVADAPPGEVMEKELLEKVYGIAMDIIPRDGGGLVVVPCR